MDIECPGCYYTLCSFVCLTEDLSEILQFLWKHGCLRKAYSCEKCGKKCAIGDKDLFFRCNRNLVDDPTEQMTPQFQPSQQHHTSHAETNGGLHLELQAMPHHYMLSQHTHHPRPEGPLLNLHPALRHSPPLPGDPMPPSHASPVIPQFDRHFLLNAENLVHFDVTSDERGEKILTVMDRNPNILQSVPVDDMGSLPESELADLDAHAKNHKRRRNGSSTSSGSVLSLKKRCNFKVSMKKGTLFEKSKLPIDTVCKFVVFWCCMKHPTQEFLRNELSLATRTVVDWSTTCREICIHWAKSNSEKIGGDGVMVQVDEVKVVSGKTDDGNRYSFWGIEKDKEKGKIFIVPVPVCDSWSLLTVVNEWILPGSVIISNCWKTYDCLKLQEYVQQTIVHSKTFVHPPNHAGQNNFDCKQEEGGSTGGIEMQMPRFGTRRSHHLGDLAEFMFKRRFSNHLERMHAFFRQVALAYPLR